MDVAVRNRMADEERIGNKADAPCTDATFTEIYEAIYYNQSLVKSELCVLQQLIQKKLMQKANAPPAAAEPTSGSFLVRRL